MGVAGCSECNIIIDGRLVKKIEPLFHCIECGLRKCKSHHGQLNCSSCSEKLERCVSCINSCELCEGQYCLDCENWIDDYVVTYLHEWKMFVCGSCKEDHDLGEGVRRSD